MKKKVLLSTIAFLVMMMQFCAGRQYVTPAYVDKSTNHRIVAVVPFEMVFTGKKPRKLTVRQVREIEEAESIAFQESLYRLLLRQTTRYRHPVRVGIQPVDKTNRILERNNIGIRDSWEMAPEELARILRVDAIVKTRVIKRRFMSGLASFGIEVGNAVLNAILEDTPFAVFVPNSTNAIKAECFICNGRDGVVLWGIDLVDETDWRMPANEIIDNINRYFARKFPYR